MFVSLVQRTPITRYNYLSVCFQGHQDEVFVLEAHPTDPHILLSAGEWFFLLSPYVDKSLISSGIVIIQRAVTNGPLKSGRINRVAILKGFFK